MSETLLRHYSAFSSVKRLFRARVSFAIESCNYPRRSSITSSTTIYALFFVFTRGSLLGAASTSTMSEIRANRKATVWRVWIFLFDFLSSLLAFASSPISLICFLSLTSFILIRTMASRCSSTNFRSSKKLRSFHTKFEFWIDSYARWRTTTLLKAKIMQFIALDKYLLRLSLSGLLSFWSFFAVANSKVPHAVTYC